MRKRTRTRIRTEETRMIRLLNESLTSRADRASPFCCNDRANDRMPSIPQYRTPYQPGRILGPGDKSGPDVPRITLLYHTGTLQPRSARSALSGSPPSSSLAVQPSAWLFLDRASVVGGIVGSSRCAISAGTRKAEGWKQVRWTCHRARTQGLASAKEMDMRRHC